MVHHTQYNADLEAAGSDELTLVAVRYTGEKSIYRDPAMATQGGWPSSAALVGGSDGPGPWSVSLIPSKRAGWFEGHADLEIAYDPATIAEAYLRRNSLPGHIFGNQFSPETRERVFEELGIKRARMTAEGYRETLAEIAGIDESEVDEEAESYDGFAHDLTRPQLVRLVGAFDHPFDNPSHENSTAIEEFLEGHDKSAVKLRADQVLAGEDPAPYTPVADTAEPVDEEEADADDDEQEDAE